MGRRGGQGRWLDDGGSSEVIVKDGLAIGFEDGFGGHGGLDEDVLYKSHGQRSIFIRSLLELQRLTGIREGRRRGQWSIENCSRMRGRRVLKEDREIWHRWCSGCWEPVGGGLLVEAVKLDSALVKKFAEKPVRFAGRPGR